MPIFDLKVLADGSLVISTFPIDKNDYGKLLIYDSKGSLKDRVKYCESLNPMLDIVRFEIDQNFNFYIAFAWLDKIEKIDKSGKILWSKSFFNKKDLKTKKIGFIEVPELIVYKEITFDVLGNLFVLTGRIAKNKSRDVYVLDSNGNLLATFTLPDSSHCIYMDQKNFLYARADIGATLKKYFLKYEFKAKLK